MVESLSFDCSVLNQEQRVNENREGDFNRMREVKLSGYTANCEAGEDSRDRGLRGEGVE
jgi:hypothetical protein